MWHMTPFFTVLLSGFIVMIIAATISISLVFAQTSDFNTGYSDGNQQGLSDRHSNVFHIGNVCINQSNSYCNGYLSGYLDGFFSTLPTSTHTTTRIIVHEEHPKCHDNMTDCGKKTPPTPPTPPCKKVNGTCV
jgi:hypothetical protein